jgi:outer membrane protein OmpA-like peptidoglycan-associated protein
MFATRRHPRHLCPVPRQSIIDELEETPRREESWALWIILGLLLSAALHLAFVWWARDYPVKTFSDSYYDQLVPRAFKVDRVDIDAALLEEKETPAETPRSIAPVPVELPPENIADEADSPSSVADKPAQLGLDAELLPEVHHTRSLDQLAPDTTVALEEDLQSMRDTLLADQPASPRQPALALGEIAGGPSGAGAADSDVPAGYSNLDELLARTGALAPHDAPIFMPADVLFGYDESFLRPDAITSLGKLGELIRRNPSARFRIEGHTDSFGSPDYNARLSLARAESVKQWLAGQMAIDPARIDTRGLGNSRPLVAASGNIEEQQLNRRVEIVILRPGAAR